MSPATGTAAIVTPDVLYDIGRDLILHGQYLAQFVVDEQGPRLVRPADHDVAGGADPASWTYKLMFSGPSRQTTGRGSRSDVIHITINAAASSPWRGVSPVVAAASTAGTLAGIEKQLAAESSHQSGYVIPAAGLESLDPGSFAQLVADMSGIKGATRLVPSRWARDLVIHNHDQVIEIGHPSGWARIPELHCRSEVGGGLVCVERVWNTAGAGVSGNRRHGNAGIAATISVHIRPAHIPNRPSGVGACARDSAGARLLGAERIRRDGPVASVRQSDRHQRGHPGCRSAPVDRHGHSRRHDGNRDAEHRPRVISMPQPVPVVRRTAGGTGGASRGGGPIDYDAVRSVPDAYRLLLRAIMAVPSGAAIADDGDGCRGTMPA